MSLLSSTVLALVVADRNHLKYDRAQHRLLVRRFGETYVIPLGTVTKGTDEDWREAKYLEE